MGTGRTVGDAAVEHRTALLEAVFRYSPIGKALVSPEGQFIAVNQALASLLGFTPEHLQTLTFQEITFPDDLEADLQLLQELTRGERDHYTMLKRYVHRDGHHVWAQLDVAMVTEHSGLPAFFIAQVQDVTDRVQEHRELNERLKVAMEATQDVIWDWRPPQPAVQVAGPWAALTGLDDAGAQVSWRRWWRQVHPADRRRVGTQFLEHLRGERARVDIQYRQRVTEGWRWLALRGRVTHWHAGRPDRLAGTLSDIDERVRAEHNLSVLLDHLPAMISYWDTDLRARFVNRAFLQGTGEPSAHVGRHARDLLGEDAYMRALPAMRRALDGEELSVEQRFMSTEGVRHLQMHFVPDREGGDITGFFELSLDITRLRETERALSAQQELAHVTLMSIGDSVITTDPQGRVTFLNPVAQRMTGWTLEAAQGQPIEVVMPLTTEGSGEPMRNPLRQALRDGRVTGMPTGAVLRSRDGQLYSVEDSAAPITADGGEQVGGVIVFHDVTEKRALAERMTYLAQHDALTGLPNRTLLHDRISQWIQHSQRQGVAFALAFLDLDGFKAVNDTLGHAAGDQLLRQVAARLTAHLRASDTISRVGGDEFVLLLPELLNPDHARVLTGKVLEALVEPFQIGPHEVRVTGSLGLALYPSDGMTVEDLMRHADVAMYRAKADGRNRACCFNEQVEAELLARHRMVQAVRQAVALQQFYLVYQPKVIGTTGQVIGAEALLRWTHEGEPVSPAVFIPIAEEAGLMSTLGTWVLREACHQARAWWQSGSPLRVAVNVSASQFREHDFLNQVRTVLQDTGLPANLLELELTEAVLMQDLARVRELLRELQDLGVSISIDDFGTGYSSLSYLHQLPLNTLKIDRSFVQDAHSDAQQGALLRTIIMLGRTLNLDVLAEGVETVEDCQHLLDNGCEYMQGYLFSRPVPAADLTARLTLIH